jgi:hypothetical protein
MMSHFVVIGDVGPLHGVIPLGVALIRYIIILPEKRHYLL